MVKKKTKKSKKMEACEDIKAWVRDQLQKTAGNDDRVFDSLCELTRENFKNGKSLPSKDDLVEKVSYLSKHTINKVVARLMSKGLMMKKHIGSKFRYCPKTSEFFSDGA